MNTDKSKSELNGITEAIIGAAFEVGNTMGCGFLEKVYENAMVVELRKRGRRVTQQHPIEVRYGDAIVGEYVADLIVDEKVIVELKAQFNLDRIHHAQCLNYLRGTGLRLALLLNFGRPRVDVHRIAN
jgi:GxxExxY protein